MKTSFLKYLLLATTFTIALPIMAADIPNSKDNPYLKRFQGSEIFAYKARNFDKLTFSEKDDLNQTTVVEGELIRIGYRLAPSTQTSSLEVYRNYENELKSKGFDILNSGSFTDLKIDGNAGVVAMGEGGYDQFYSGATLNWYQITAVKHDPAGDIHVRVLTWECSGAQGGFQTGDVAVEVDTVKVKAVGNKMVDGSATDMSKQLAATGSVNLYGIYFDTDKTDIKPESKATLDEVGKLLTSDATLKLKVVGHTDNVGSADHNNDLSMRRAQSVVNELVATYSVSADRLTPFGAGSTQPVATNNTDDGRAKNRRVELVKL